MKPAAARTVHVVDFGTPRPTRPTQTPTGRVPRVVRLLALAHRIEGMVRSGQLRDYADAARVLVLTRARVTQVMNLLLLSPSIQTAILDLPTTTKGRDPITERQIRKIAAEPFWETQAAQWRKTRG